MEHIHSQEAARINVLAAYNLLPHLPADLVKIALPEIGKYTFNMLDQYLFLKLTDNKSRFHSPSRLQKESPQLIKNTNAVRVRQHEKISQRYEEMKRKDPVLDFDLIEHFWTRIRELSVNLALQPLQLQDCISDEHVRKQFVNLVNGVSAKYEAHMKSKAQDDSNQVLE